MTPTAGAEITLSHRFADELPELAVDWQAVEPPAPRLLALNDALAADLGLDPTFLRTPEGARFLTGTAVPHGARPVAQAYAGHQFGAFNPRLGDGRALLLGEITGPGGALRDIHLKGSGPTPFSRGGDGLAAVGPMLREYVISEAMHALGIPTTRALAVVATGRTVRRESTLPGAVLTRVASSHLRVGTFVLARATGDIPLLERLVDHAIARHYPHLEGAENRALALLDAVIDAQARLIARWMLVGFVHGVMNTDNMTISGETIDYGPCAFLDAFDVGAVYSSIDQQGRYAYGAQPAIGEWNLARFAEALLPLLAPAAGSADTGADMDAAMGDAVATAQQSLAAYRDIYNATWAAGMHAKLGGTPDDERTAALVNDMFDMLAMARIDYTSFFRHLAAAARGDREPARALFTDPAPFDLWVERWLALAPDADLMDRVNPLYIPRNHLVEEVLSAASDDDDLAPFEELVDVIRRPFTARPGLTRYEQPAPEAFGPYVTYCGT